MERMLFITYLFVIFFALIYGKVLGSHFNTSVVASFLENLSKRLPQERVKSIHPLCMQTWHVETKALPRIKQFFEMYFKPYERHFLKEGNCLQDHKVVVSGTQHMFHAINHFPHTSKVFLRFYSSLLWQQYFYPGICIRNFLLNSSYTSAWFQFTHNNTWNNGMLSTVSNTFAMVPLISELYPHNYSTHDYFPILFLHSWHAHSFIHPSDGVLFTSSVLGKDPCELHQQGSHLLEKPLSIFVLQRSSRKFLNFAEIKSFLTETFEAKTTFQSVTKPTETIRYAINSIKYGTFSAQNSFQDQAKLLSQTDIFISVHGAGLTNLLFMNPCSVVIEVLPAFYFAGYFFQELAKSVDILHYDWMESMENTVRPRKDSPHCAAVISVMTERFFSKKKGYNYSYSDIYQTLREEDSCLLSGSCSSCGRDVDGIHANITILWEKIRQAVEDRKTCITTHPFFRVKA